MSTDNLFKVDSRAIKIVDSREPEEIRMKLLELGWQQKMIYSADYAFQSRDFHKIGITRKAIPDLISSVNEIWAKQLEEMLEYYDTRIILLEGSWERVRPSMIMGAKGVSYLTWDMLWNFLRRWQDKGFSLELTISPAHTIQRLNVLYALYQKEYSMSAMTNKFADDRVLAFPSGCRGKTAQQILDNGKSLADVASMGSTELMGYNKIGEKKADLIISHFNRRTEIKDIQKPKEEITDGRNKNENNAIEEELGAAIPISGQEIQPRLQDV